MINLAVVNSILPNVMPKSFFQDRGAATATPTRSKRNSYIKYKKELKYRVLAAWDSSKDKSKAEVAAAFGLEKKAIDHFIGQRRKGKL